MMNKKEIVILIMTILGGSLSGIGLYFGFDMNGLTLLENGLVAVFTGCVFALPTYLISTFFSKDAYNKVNDKMRKVYNILNEMDSLVQSNNISDIKERAKKINDIINQVNSIRNDNILVTHAEIDEVTLYLTKLSRKILNKNTFDLNDVQDEINNSKSAIEIYLKMDSFK